MARERKADLARLEQLRGELTRIHDEATEILAAGDPRAALVLAQLVDAGREFDGFLPYARDEAAGYEERRQVTADYVNSRYAVPQRGGVA